MSNTNPGGIDLNTSPYFDDYSENKKFVRVLYRPGRAVQARELTQAQTLNQVQIRRFANYFFKTGSIVDGLDQNLDLNMEYVKLQSTFNSVEVDVDNFLEKIIFGETTGIKAYVGLVSDVSGTDPKTLFINYLSTGSILLSVNTAPTTLTPGNTITLSTGNTATIETVFTNPLTLANTILVSNVSGTLTATTANTVDSLGSVVPINITSITDKRSNTIFDNSELLFTSNTTSRSYANSLATNATKIIVDEGLSTEKTYTKGSKITISEGIIYFVDHFIKHDTQTLILDKYTNEPSYKIGIVPSKSFVDYIEDSSLLDNAQGTPNYQAPGADRFKIDTVLTKVALETQTDENEFATLLEVENGIARKRKLIGVENKLEDAMAQRTSEESGDYVLNDPQVFIREHLSQDNNGGRYSTAEGGNTNLLLVEVDPFTCYVSGYRNQLIVKSEIDLLKGLDTEYIEQTKTQINYGQYIEVQELVGSWDIMESTKVDLYDTAQQAITQTAYSTKTVSGNKIGEARIRSIEYVSGNPGTATARYYLYLYEITMNSGQLFENVRSIYDSATPKRYADIVLNSFGQAVLNENAFNTMIFKLPYSSVKTIRDDQQNVESGFRFKKKFEVTFSSGVATIATTDSSESFIGTGLLSSSQKNNFYMVVVNNAGANVETANLTGTVTISSGNNYLGGSGTSFTTEINTGDLLKINSETLRVNSIQSDTLIILDTNHSAGASANTFTKILPTGNHISLSSYGGSGSLRTINVSSPGTVIIDLKENATFTADVIVSMNKSNAREKLKTLNYQTSTVINPNTHPNGIGGPFSLGYADIYQLHAIYQSSSFSVIPTTSNTLVTTNYTLDNGQRDYAYEHGTISTNPGITPTGQLLVVFDHFTHDTTQGIAYASVDSYPVNDSVISNTTITTSEIPSFVSLSTGETYNLRDCLDFRPIKTANTSSNPLNNLGYNIPTGGLHVPVSSSDFDADLIFYKGRISKVFINNRGVFGINDGASSSSTVRKTQSPPKLPDTLEIAELVIPPYPSQPKDVRIKLLKNKRFTMKDISQISDRVERLEYFTTLNYLEKLASEKTEIDEDGFDRFKNGILVDPFTGYSIANPLSADYAASIDSKERFLTCEQDNTNTISILYNSISSTTTLSTGNKVYLPYTEEVVPGLQQLYASRQLRLAEELNFIWTGELNAYPFVDNWVETTNDPTKNIVYNDTGDADNWNALINAWNSEIAPLKKHWIGETSLVSGTRQTNRDGNFEVTSQLQRTVETEFNQLSSISSSPKQSVSGDRVIDVTSSLWMRTRDFVVHATGLKNNSKLYAFFDGINVTSSCKQIRLTGTKTLEQIIRQNFNSSDFLTGENVDWITVATGALSQDFRVNNNEIYLIFRVPVRAFYVGQREFKVTDSSTNSDGTTLTAARNTIFAQGISQVKSAITINSRPFDVSFNDSNAIRVLSKTVTNEQRIEISRRTVAPAPPPQRVYDPVSQSFFVDSETYPQGFYITSVDLYFRTKSQDDNRNVRVEIREMINGFPSTQVIGIGDHAIVNNANINVSEDASLATKFTFKNPIYLGAGNEYCFTIKPENNDPDFAIWVAELGEIDITDTETETIIESAYNSGVVFTSSNDRTWTPRQNLDVKFTIRVANFGIISKEAYFTNVTTNNEFSYDTFIPIIGDQIIPGTNINYEIKTADSTFTVDSSYNEIKNYELFAPSSRKQISNSTQETNNSFNSLSLKATLSTINQYISPYIDLENFRFAFSRNKINNAISTSVNGTVQYSNGSSIVVGTGTDFANDVFAGEYALFGTEYRKVQQVSNNTHLVVNESFTTSNAINQTITIRNEENPAGPYSSETRYITKLVTLNDGFEASDLIVYLKTNRPPGTSVKVYSKILNEYDTDSFDEKFYLPMTLTGTETFTLNENNFTEEKFILSSSLKTGGLELLSGTVSISNSTTNVLGTSTKFIEDLKIGDTIAVGLSKTQRTVTTISNNTFLTVDSAFSTVTSDQDVFKVLNNQVAYTTPDGRVFNGYKYFAIKIVFTSSNPNYAPKVKELRAIALA